jgi:predicted transcriptional regulator of viral defense system
MKTAEFFATHPVFTRTEFAALLHATGTTAPGTVTQLLQHHVKTGRLLLVRSGLYVVLPPGADPDRWPVDLFLVSSRLADDAVLSYHSALEFLGYAYSTQQRVIITTRHSLRPFRFRGTDVVGTKPPAGLLGRDADLMLVEQVDRQGLLVRVTSPERTLVDVLDRPRLAGTWEEIWRSLESIPAVDVEHVVAYASLLSSATTVARVGFFLEQHRSRIRVTGHQLQILHALQPASVSYLDKGARGTLVRQWNLVVPEEVLHRSWEEPA